MAAQQNQPLPPGWEAKYDPGQRRYFFIDHATKKTSWVDPRTTQPWAGGAQQSVRHSPQVPAKHESIPMTHFTGHSSTASTQETTFHQSTEKNMDTLKKLFPTAPDWKIKNALTRHENRMKGAIEELERSGYSQADPQSQKKEAAIVKKLNTEFPSAEVGVIRDIVQCFDNNEEKARDELKALGYTPAAASKPRSTSTSPTRAKSPTKEREPSEAQKAQMQAKLAGEFPDYSEAMIGIALNSTSYKLDNARRIIQTMQKQRTSKNDSRTTSPTKGRTRSPSPASTSTSYATKDNSRTHTPDFSKFDATFNIPSPSFGLPKKTTTTKRHPAEQSVTSRLAKSPKKSTAANRTATTSAYRHTTHTSAYVSPNRTQAMGPNRDLARGPDKDLLIDDYEAYSGANPDLYHGPNPNNRQGPSGAVGPDRSLRLGPDADTHMGADPELWKGSGVNMSAEQKRMYMTEI